MRLKCVNIVARHIKVCFILVSPSNIFTSICLGQPFQSIYIISHLYFVLHFLNLSIRTCCYRVLFFYCSLHFIFLICLHFVFHSICPFFCFVFHSMCPFFCFDFHSMCPFFCFVFHSICPFFYFSIHLSLRSEIRCTRTK